MEKVQDTEQTMEVFENDIQLYLSMFCENNGIEDMSKESQQRWTAALMFINRNVFKVNDNMVRYNNKNSIIDYKDIEQIDSIYNIYSYLCYLYDKEITIDGFSKLTGITAQTLYNWENKEYRSSRYYSVDTGEEIKDIAEWKMNHRGEYKTELSTTHLDFMQKLRQDEEESTYQKGANCRGNQTIFLARLNRRNGWNLPGVSKERTSERALTASELPKLGEIKQIESEKY